ncbi:hypothetical protein E1091_17475 [Micromonospora fluostatini]|uniref:Uncharacterized protein n=1 Tax=Micromonospora fluostatini TaxID=1629071 RepID=A0ABY2DCW8_9ACTN|nr:hypothetical protein E1091_17475 [Micromonospora fluostatini]
MNENTQPSYVALVAALRSEFSPMALEALRIQLAEHRYVTSSISVLVQAVIDAGDLTFDPGDGVHPAVRKFLHNALAEQECTHGADCLLHPNANQPHNFDTPWASGDCGHRVGPVAGCPGYRCDPS